MPKGYEQIRTVRPPDPGLFARPVREVRPLAHPFAPPDYALAPGPRPSPEAQDYLIDAMERRGYRVVRILAREEHAPYTSLVVTRGDAGELVYYLAALGRGGQSVDPRAVAARFAAPSQASAEQRALQRARATRRAALASRRRALRLDEGTEETPSRDHQDSGHPSEAQDTHDGERGSIHDNRNTHAARRSGASGD